MLLICGLFIGSANASESEEEPLQQQQQNETADATSTTTTSTAESKSKKQEKVEFPEHKWLVHYFMYLFAIGYMNMRFSIFILAKSLFFTTLQLGHCDLLRQCQTE